MILGFDYIGWLVVFAFGLCMIVFTLAMYFRESRGSRRSAQMARWRRGIHGALIGTVLAGLRRFVFHQ